MKKIYQREPFKFCDLVNDFLGVLALIESVFEIELVFLLEEETDCPLFLGFMEF